MNKKLYRFGMLEYAKKCIYNLENRTKVKQDLASKGRKEHGVAGFE
jgi:hypothetical protein